MACGARTRDLDATGLMQSMPGTAMSFGMAALMAPGSGAGWPGWAAGMLPGGSMGPSMSWPSLSYSGPNLPAGSQRSSCSAGWRDPVSAVAERICELVSHGFGSQLVVSADVGRSSRLRGVGGSGYVEGVHRLLAALKAMGLSQDLLDGMTTTGPARFLAFTGSRG